MTVTIHLPQAMLDRAQAEAQASGEDLDTFVKEAIAARLARRKRPLAEVLKPIHDAIDASGLSEVQVEGLLEQELKAHRSERHSSMRTQ
jgi:hypothetical protein